MSCDPIPEPTVERTPTRGVHRIGPSAVLDRELWQRRNDRRETQLTASMPQADAMLAPLVLALARLAAQRDSRVAFANDGGR